MSSSESSEDEEETKKINEAIIPNDLLSTLTSFSSQKSKSLGKTDTDTDRCKITNSGTSDAFDNSGSCANGNDKPKLNSLAMKFKKAERYIDTRLLKLKSNRPDKITEEDKSLYHATTPGFRTHIEKHLKKILDSDIETRMEDSVWKEASSSKEKAQRGIKLFSDVKSVCFGDPATPKHQDVMVVISPPKIRPKKHKLNSRSSESSDDEDKINACIFTVDDIMQENRMLNNLSKSGMGKEIKKDDSILNTGDVISVNIPSNKYQRVDETNTNSDNVIKMPGSNRDELITVCQSEIKKKRKKSQENSNYNDKHHAHHNDEEPIKKKKKKKRKSGCDDVTHLKNDNLS